MRGHLDPQLPLLHVVGTVATRVMTVDTRVLALAAIGLGLAVAAIWAPAAFRPSRLRRRGFWLQALRLLACVMVFLAVLPTVLPYDHLLMHDDHPSAAGEAVHAEHCHVSPGSCSDVPMTSGPGQLFMNQPLVLAPVMLSILLALFAPVLTGMTPRPDLRPPSTRVLVA